MTGFGGIDPTNFYYPNIQFASFSENLEERDLNNRIDKFDEFIEWKLIEQEDIKSKLIAINNLNVKKDVILFIVITIFAIIIPQIILYIYPLFINYSFLNIYLPFIVYLYL